MDSNGVKHTVPALEVASGPPAQDPRVKLFDAAKIEAPDKGPPLLISSDKNVVLDPLTYPDGLSVSVNGELKGWPVYSTNGEAVSRRPTTSPANQHFIVDQDVAIRVSKIQRSP